MRPRAIWKGRLVLGELACGVALYTASSTSDRIAFHTLNRATGNRVSSEFVDADTGKPVAKDDQIKGYELENGDHILLDPKEIAAAVPDSDKTLSLETFLECNDIDSLYFDRPYYVAPAEPASSEVFALIREGMRAKRVAAVTRTVLFRRCRTVLIRPHEDGLIANTLNFDYEVRAADDVFQDIPTLKITGEMLDLAKHIIGTKTGEFDPAEFDDRYESALEDLIKAKLQGKTIPKAKAQPKGKVVDLLTALRESVGKPSPSRRKSPEKSTPRKKAG